MFHINSQLKLKWFVNLIGHIEKSIKEKPAMNLLEHVSKFEFECQQIYTILFCKRA